MEHQTERPDVRPTVDRATANLLGSHVGPGAGTLAGIGHARSRHPGDPEVEDLQDAATGQEEVRGLDVAMNQTHGVRRRQAAGGLQQELDGFVRFDGAAFKPFAQCHAFVARHCDVEPPVRRLVRRVDRAHVRMVERRRRASLSQEAPLRALVEAEGGREELQGYLAL